MKRQSPSRLETMLVSPLAWVLNEAGAKETYWLPSGLDILTQGNLFHAVMENLFQPSETLSSEEDLQAAFDDAFEQAVSREAPFLREATWRVEAASHKTQAWDMVRHWRNRLDELGATVLGSEQELQGTAHGLRLRGFADAVIGLPDGQRLVVDFKTAKSKGRRDRMERGWDLQVALYRQMIKNFDGDVSGILGGNDRGDVAIAYHLLRDGVTLTSGLKNDQNDLEAVEGDISEKAVARLVQTVAELGGGMVRLNDPGDVKMFEKEAGLTPYALTENPLVMAFAVEQEREA